MEFENATWTGNLAQISDLTLV